MKKTKETPFLRQILLRLLLVRLLIPLLIVQLVVVAGVAYILEKNLQNHQKQVAKYMSHLIEYHIDCGTRVLETLANTLNQSSSDSSTDFMKSTYESYGYFDTIYFLDKNSKVTSIMPLDTRYLGLDMSNLPNLNDNTNVKNITISSPFISVRTGEPTVYLIMHTANGSCVVGELNLGLFQKEINEEFDMPGKDFIFIMDHQGMLLAHPNANLVNQQVNMSNLTIFKDALRGKTSDIYVYDHKNYIGSAVKLHRTGWVVVNQISVYDFWSSYTLALLFWFLASLLIYFTLVLNLRKQFERNVTFPLEQLTRKTNSLTIGDFGEADLCYSIPTSYVEINKLLIDFQLMTKNLQLRETAIRESENRHRGLINRLPIGLFRAKLDGEILSVNPMVLTIIGFPENNELFELNIVNFVNRYSEEGRRNKYNIEDLSRFNNFETELHCYDGRKVWIQIEVHIVYNMKNEKEFIEGSIQDITERKNSEIKLKEQQELLIKSEKEKREVLEKTLIMKDEFIGLISHEFKTPLNVIYSAIQLIECVYLNKIPDRVQELIGNIKQNTFRQLRLANNLLDMTRMNADKIKLNIRNIDIVLLTRVITESVEIYAGQKNIKIGFKSNTDSRTISIDDEKYERIVLNILSNAMKFTPSGGEIKVILKEEKEKDFIEVRIIDTGIGIPKEKHLLIFERFGQVDSNLSRRAEGTGIGLSLVKLLLKSMGGKIKVESELGEGSTFIIKIPIREECCDQTEKFFDVQNELVSKIKVEFSDIYL